MKLPSRMLDAFSRPKSWNPNTLKTRRERIVHNERVKLRAAWLSNAGLAFGVAGIVAFMYSAKPAAEYAHGLIGLVARMGFIGLLWYIAVLFQHLSERLLDNIEDPDDLPKPPRKRAKKPAKK